MGQNKIVGIIAVIVIIAALGFIGWRSLGGKGGGDIKEGSKETGVLICSSCKAEYQAEIPEEMLVVQGAQLKCEKCGQQTATPATKCKHCKEYFVLDMMTPDPKCSKCGKSQSQQAPQPAGAAKE